jgi:hypothetical protein
MGQAKRRKQVAPNYGKGLREKNLVIRLGEFINSMEPYSNESILKRQNPELAIGVTSSRWG